jgi:hypothetical protein
MEPRSIEKKIEALKLRIELANKIVLERLTFLSSAGKNGRIRREISLLPVHFSVLSH